MIVESNHRISDFQLLYVSHYIWYLLGKIRKAGVQSEDLPKTKFEIEHNFEVDQIFIFQIFNLFRTPDPF